MSENKSHIDTTPAVLIMSAVQSGTDLVQLEKLLELQERWDANQAKKVFSDAFARAQKGMNAVAKKKFNPQTKSKYADLGDVIEGAKPIYTNEGFSVIFYEGDTALPEHVRIYADILHSKGHKETYHFDVPMDGKGIQGNANMTKIHAKASSVAYGRRYLMCMIWNIPTQDIDGNEPKEAPKTVKPLDFINNLAVNKLGGLDEFKAWRIENKYTEDLTKAEKPELEKILKALQALK